MIILVAAVGALPEAVGAGWIAAAAWCMIRRYQETIVAERCFTRAVLQSCPAAKLFGGRWGDPRRGHPGDRQGFGGERDER
jgi:hypothetical protein